MDRGDDGLRGAAAQSGRAPQSGWSTQQKRSPLLSTTSPSAPTQRLIPRQPLKPASLAAKCSSKAGGAYAISVGSERGVVELVPGSTAKAAKAVVSWDLSRAPQPFVDEKARRTHLEIVEGRREDATSSSSKG